jgi:restriction system protein
VARGSSDYERWARQQQREVERRQRAAAAAARAAERERKQQHIAASHDEAARLTGQLDGWISELESILRAGLERPARIDVNGLRRHAARLRLDLGDRAEHIQPPRWEDFQPGEPGVLATMLGGRGRYERRTAEAKEEFARALGEHEVAERQRQA